MKLPWKSLQTKKRACLRTNIIPRSSLAISFLYTFLILFFLKTEYSSIFFSVEGNGIRFSRYHICPTSDPHMCPRGISQAHTPFGTPALTTVLELSPEADFFCSRLLSAHRPSPDSQVHIVSYFIFPTQPDGSSVFLHTGCCFCFCLLLFSFRGIRQKGEQLKVL